MRKISFLALAATLLFAACGNHKPKDTVVIDDGKNKVSLDPTGITQTDVMQKKIEELKKLAPLTMDQLKVMLPEELMGIKRSSFNANSAMGAAMGTAEYQKDDTSRIKLSVFDCAGEAGSAFYSMNFFLKMNVESENNNGYTKSVDFMGQKALESYDKGNEEYTLSYLANDRLLVTIEGEHVGLDAVKQASQSLHLK